MLFFNYKQRKPASDVFNSWHITHLKHNAASAGVYTSIKCSFLRSSVKTIDSDNEIMKETVSAFLQRAWRAEQSSLSQLLTMSVPRSMQRMVTVPSGRGTLAMMKRRKGEISGMLLVNVYAMDFFKLSKMRRPAAIRNKSEETVKTYYS